MVATWHKSGENIRSAQASFLLRRSVSFSIFFCLGVLFAAACFSSKGHSLGLHLPVTLLSFAAEPADSLLHFNEYGLSMLYASFWRAFPIPVIMLLGLRDYHYYVLSDFWDFLFCAPHGMLLYCYCRWLTVNAVQTSAACVLLCVLYCLAIAAIIAAHSRLLYVNRVAITGLAVPCLHPRGGQRYRNEAERESMKVRASRYVRTAVGESAIVFTLEVILTLIGYLLRVVLGAN